MNKIKGIRPVYFITCLTFGITLFLICAMINSGTSTANVGQLSDVSSEIYANQQIAFLNEQNKDDRLVTSRGTSNRYEDYKLNQIEKQIQPSAEAAAPTEVKPAPQPTPTEVKPAPQAEPTNTAASQYEEDLDLLARLITAEAQGEPYEAQVAVGAVVMNRLKSGLWANTITDVIYQNINGYYQFTPVVNGWINKPAQAESIQAAKAAMGGADPTNGAQFYYDDKVTNTWILSKPVSVQIGHMIYAY